MKHRNTKKPTCRLLRTLVTPSSVTSVVFRRMAPPKFDASKVITAKIRVTGGDPTAGPSITSKLGPLGVQTKKVMEEVSKITGDYKGLRVPIELSIQNRVATPKVVPSASLLCIKALNEPYRDRKKTKIKGHFGSISYEKLLEIARAHRPRSQSRSLAGTVKEILGTVASIGASIDGVHPKIITTKIKNGELAILDA